MLQSTPSARRATAAGVGALVPVLISIHTLLAEGDLVVMTAATTGSPISTLALLVEGDHMSENKKPRIAISIRALLAEGDVRL